VVIGTFLQVVQVDLSLLMWQIHSLGHLDMFHLMEMVYQILLQVLGRIFYGNI
jgi:hypothetical protein